MYPSQCHSIHGSKCNKHHKATTSNRSLQYLYMIWGVQMAEWSATGVANLVTKLETVLSRTFNTPSVCHIDMWSLSVWRTTDLHHPSSASIVERTTHQQVVHKKQQILCQWMDEAMSCQLCHKQYHRLPPCQEWVHHHIQAGKTSKLLPVFPIKGTKVVQSLILCSHLPDIRIFQTSMYCPLWTVAALSMCRHHLHPSQMIWIWQCLH